MLHRCLFCFKPFHEGGSVPGFPGTDRIAYDPERGRLWAICPGCHRWNLCPIEDRARALDHLERIARDSAHLVARTANISLLQADPLVLVRVGRAGLTEQSWWRYGRELHRRKKAFESTGARLSAYTFGAMAYIGEIVGLTEMDMSLGWDDAPLADVLRWRRFGWAAWHGRVDCPHCHSVLRALRYDMSWWLYPLARQDGSVAVGIPCPRCDPWTPDKLYVLEGDQAEHALRRVLAYQHVAGASERRVRDATRAIEEAGSAVAYTERVATERSSLWKLGPVRTVALEIALNEAVERRLLSLEARALDFIWRREEELARIIDEELTPLRRLETHLRHLPAGPWRQQPKGQPG